MHNRLLLVFFWWCFYSVISHAESAQPELISPGKISSVLGEHSPTFDINSSELVFMRRTPGEFDYTLYSTRFANGQWSSPTKLPFSGTYRDGAPYFSPNGNLIAFDSQRPAEGLTKNSINLWVAQRTGQQQWKQPELMRTASVNDPNEPRAGLDEFGPVIVHNGDVLFYSFRSPKREGAMYLVTNDQKLTMSSELPDPSSDTFVGYLTLSSDGNTAVMEGRGQRSNKTDLYYACRNRNGWGEAKPLESVNTLYGEGTPFLTADNKWLWFASDRNTNNILSDTSNLYRVSTEHLPIPCD